MVNGFGNTSYSDKKNQFSWQGQELAEIACFKGSKLLLGSFKEFRGGKKWGKHNLYKSIQHMNI